MKSNLFWCLFLLATATATSLPANRNSKNSDGSIQAWDFFARPSSISKVILSPGIGTPVYFGHVGLGLHFCALVQITKQYPIYIGGETGINFFGSQYYSRYHYGSSNHYTDLPLLGTAVYRFNIPQIPSLHPFGGVAIGPHLALTGGRGVAIEVAARHGVLWRASRNFVLQGEFRVGILGGDYLYEPIASVAFQF